jgi:DNA (cytosine-5)-methyltransferase 1
MNKKITITSLFSGAGGLDLGFRQAGFHTIWANEFDRHIWQTFETNFPNTTIDHRDINQIKPEEIPDADGIVGGPPCQSWSNAGKGLGLSDTRGQLFKTYIKIIKMKQPKFFLCENVAGIVSLRHIEAFISFLRDFELAGYRVSWKLLNAHDYGVPQSRKRVIIVGVRKDLGK